MSGFNGVAMPALTKADIVNNLTNSATDKPLSANMGNVLSSANLLWLATKNTELTNNLELSLTDSLENFKTLLFVYCYGATGIWYQRSFVCSPNDNVVIPYMTLDTSENNTYAYIGVVSGNYQKLKVLGGGTNRPYLKRVYGLVHY